MKNEYIYVLIILFHCTIKTVQVISRIIILCFTPVEKVLHREGERIYSWYDKCYVFSNIYSRGGGGGWLV
jgi:hypothetical protein